MKIVLSIRNLGTTSGVERVVVNLANAFCNLGHEVEIACYYKDEQDRISTFPVDEKVSVHYVYPHLSYHANYMGLKKILWKWFKHIVLNLRINARYTDTDIIIESDFAFFYPRFRVKNTKYIKIVHSVIKKWKKKNNLFDCIVFLNEQELLKWQRSGKHVVKIPNFIPILPFEDILPKVLESVMKKDDIDSNLHALIKSHYEDMLDKSFYSDTQIFILARSMLKAWKLQNLDSNNPHTKHKLIAVGRMDAVNNHKGFPRLIDAYSKIAHKFPSWQLEIIGEDCGQKVLLEKQILNLQTKDYIFLKPFTSDMESVYLNADIFVMSSHTESMPMVLIEAASYGLPIVAYDIGTIRDCFAPNPEIKNGVAYHKNGILVPDGDENLLCEAMRELLSNEAMRLEMGRQSLILAKERFSKEVIMQEWQDLLTALKR